MRGCVSVLWLGKRTARNGHQAGLPKHDPTYLLSTLLEVKDLEMCNHRAEQRGANRRRKD